MLNFEHTTRNLRTEECDDEHEDEICRRRRERVYSGEKERRKYVTERRNSH